MNKNEPPKTNLQIGIESTRTILAKKLAVTLHDMIKREDGIYDVSIHLNTHTPLS